MTDLHSCSYYCDRPECIKAQRDELRERLAQPEQEPVAHKHEWFSTGAMKPGQMRCIHCGVWNHESAPTPRKPLTGEEPMKRIDYYWPKAATQVTGAIFLVQLLAEVIGNSKPGFEWVLPACGALFAASIAWALYAVVMNAIRARGNT